MSSVCSINIFRVLLFLFLLVFVWFSYLIAYMRAGVHIIEPAGVDGKAALTDGSSKSQPESTLSSNLRAGVNFERDGKPHRDDVHVIFSTDCSEYQDWQTLLLFYSAFASGQKGPVTRIASGCPDEKRARLDSLYESLYPHGSFAAHYTPDFKKDEKTKKSYDFYNKPRGLKHWLEFAQPPLDDDVMVALVDPDMVFLRPLTRSIRGNANNLYNKRSLKGADVMKEVAPGLPVAQQYGLGAPWARPFHRWFNRSSMCDGPPASSPCMEVEESFGSEHYSVGPPYLVHIQDMRPLATVWVDTVPRVYEKYPFLLAEMYAYSLAAAHLRLPHFQMHQYMVSNAEAGDEGWSWVDSLEDICLAPVSGTFYADRPLPTLLHYCQAFPLGDKSFYKRGQSVDMFSCGFDESKYVIPLTNAAALDASRPINEKLPRKEKNQLLYKKRNAFAYCAINRVVHDAIVDFKQRNCSKGL